MKIINSNHRYLLAGLFLLLMVVLILSQIGEPTTEIIFPDSKSIRIEKIEIAEKSLLPETINHTWNRFLNTTGIKPLPGQLVLDEEHPSITPFAPYRDNLNFKTISAPSYTGEFLFVWFSLSDPQSMMPDEILKPAWKEGRYFYGFDTGPYITAYTIGFQKYLFLKDEHGCKVSSAIVDGVQRNDGKFLFCAAFPVFNKFSSKTQLTLEFTNKYSATFEIPLPSLKAKYPAQPQPLPQSIKLSDKVTLCLDSWKFKKSTNLTLVERNTSTAVFRDGFYPKGIPSIRIIEGKYDIINSYGYDIYPLGDALGNIDDISCAYSPGWFLRGNAYLTDLSRVPPEMKLVIDGISQLKDGEVRQITLPDKSPIRYMYLLGPGVYCFNELGIQQSATLAKEAALFDELAKKIGNSDWIEPLKTKETKTHKEGLDILRSGKSRVVFALHPLPKQMKLIIQATTPSLAENTYAWETSHFTWVSPQSGTADANQYSDYDIAIGSSDIVEIGLTEKYPFSFFFATDETMQEDAKKILIQK